METTENYMQKQFVTYEIALKLKELGFNEQCMRYFNPKNDGILVLPQRITVMHNTVNSSVEEDGYCSAPLWQQVIDWFREKHYIHIEVLAFGFEDSSIPEYIYQLTDNRREVNYMDGGKLYATYEEAREDGIVKAIELRQKEKAIELCQKEK